MTVKTPDMEGGDWKISKEKWIQNSWNRRQKQRKISIFLNCKLQIPGKNIENSFMSTYSFMKCLLLRIWNWYYWHLTENKEACFPQTPFLYHSYKKLESVPLRIKNSIPSHLALHREGQLKISWDIWEFIGSVNARGLNSPRSRPWHNDFGAGSLFGEWCQAARCGSGEFGQGRVER